MDNKRSVQHSVVIPELYFLITKFLSSGPLRETAQVLIRELEQKKVLPKRIDWLGNEHDQSFAELERKYPHIGPNHLIEICCRIGPILDKELIPSVQGVISLLGSGRQNLLRTKESICRPRTLVDYCTRIHGMPLPDSASCKPNHNLLKVLIGRESAGPVRRKLLIPTNFYSKTCLLRRTLGHLSAVYCVLFDRSGRYIITGADDLLVKIWSAIDGRLLATLRGASAEITDIAVNLDNTLLAAGSLDRILRVWDLQTTAPIAVLPGHTGMITSVNFCPSPRGDLKYLVTTSTDGSVAFWQYTTPRGSKTVFAPKPIQYHEKLRPGQAQMICAAFSPGGIFLAAGSADHHVRVYIMLEDGPKRILETESHSDAVDSIQWAHRGLRFVSGSKDGTAHVWTFESQQWKSLKLVMSDRLASCPEPEEGKKLKVTMVSWDYSDKWVITAVNDFTIKIWDAKSGKLHRVLRGHKDELYVLESHPKDEHVLLSAGHDGQLFLWDIEAGVSIAHFTNNIDGQGHGGVFDAKWSPDGTMIAATDSHGHILMFGIGIGQERFNNLPRELFFHTDYRPLIRDVNHMILDEQTQMMPHLMPPPFLVDVDGNPYPPVYQRLVPGRENCPSEQLVPNIAVGPEGVEVVDGGSFSHLDRLIEALANRQGQDQAPDSNNDRGGNAYNRLNSSPRGNVPNGHRVGLRRTGDVEGVRQSSGNWQRETTYKWIRRIFVKSMKYSQLQALRQSIYAAGQDEQSQYRREMRRRPIMINTSNANTALQNSKGSRGIRGTRGTRNVRRGPRPAYRTRAVREREPVPEVVVHEEEEDDEDSSASNSSGDTSFSTEVNEDMLSESSTSDSESSDYSDWVADKPGPNLEPPKRSKRKPVQRRNFSPSSDTSQPGSKTRNKKKIPTPPENGEIPEVYRPSEWLTEVIPRKAPYYPQMGDEVVYFRQGHQRYIEAVRSKKVYKVTTSAEPWRTMDLRDHELVRIIGIKYEMKPPRLCCLKLAIINRNGQMTGRTFTIKYHDMADVIDFFVLRQTFDTAVERNWSPGDRFRCMIEDGWWMGQIESRQALSPEFPDSLFMCFKVRWDNGEYENMSPWDMEPIDENRLPAEVGGAVSVLPEELRATLYQPKPEEWPRGDREASCRRIIAGLEQVMGLAIADPFLVPVDLNIYPAYAYVVEYPIDITTIKARFENHFYRRITSAQFDVRYLATNAEKFNQSHSKIVKNARIITDLCLRIIRDPNDVDVGAVYHQLMDTYISSESENDDDDDDNEPGPSTSTPASPSKRKAVQRRNKRLRSNTDWRLDCRELLDMLWQCDDSTPFREPVDTLEHPDYLQIVDTPMDLRTVKEDLLGGNYSTPLEFAKDVRLIFQNSRNYNTNKRSRIYSMTLRLSTLFETHIKQVIYNWKAARRRANKNNVKKKTSPVTDRSKPGPSNRASTAGTSNRTGTSNRPGPSTRATTSNGNAGPSRRMDSSDDVSDDGDDEDEQRRQPQIRGSRTRNKKISRRVATSATSSNNVTSTGPPERATAGASSSSGHNLRRNTSSRPNSQEDEEEPEVEEEDEGDNTGSSSSSSSNSSSSSSSSTSSSNSSDNNSDGDSHDHNIPISQIGTGGRPKRIIARNRANDSEDSYKPNERPNRKQVKTNKRKRSNKDSQAGLKRRPSKKKRIVHSDGDEQPPPRSTIRKTTATKTRGNAYRRKQISDDQNTDDDDDFDVDSDNDKPKTRKAPRSSQKTERVPVKRARKNTEESEQHSSTENVAVARLRNVSVTHRHDTDHSYHANARTTRRPVEESDYEHELSRPTRSSLRKATNDWRRDSDDEEHEEAQRRSKRQVRRKKTSDSENSPEDSHPIASSTRKNPQFRQVRTNRNSRVLPEADDETDDEPLASHISTNAGAQRTRPVRNLSEYRQQNGGPTMARILRTNDQTVPGTTSSSTTVAGSNSSQNINVMSRRVPLAPSAAVTRSHTTTTAASTTIAASTTTSNTTGSLINSDIVPSSSSLVRGGGGAHPTFRSHVQVDHNYGEPGPSSMRYTRRTLSRHQRNADELDPHEDEIDPLEILPSTVVGHVSSRLRVRNPIVNSTTGNRNGIDVAIQRPIRQRMIPSRLGLIERNGLNHDNNDDDDDDDDEVDDDDRVNDSTENNPTDSEDNQPLMYVAAQAAAAASATTSSSSRICKMKPTSNDVSTGRSLRHRDRRYISDEDYEEDDRMVHHQRGRPRTSTRNKKRPHYNEDSEEESFDEAQPRKRRVGIRPTSPSYRQQRYNSSSATGAATAASASSNSNSRHNNNVTNDENGDSDNEQTISISSRGRVRKITAKARGLFRD